MRKLLGSLLALILILGTPACATVVSSLPIVIAAVTDGILVLDTITSFVNAYFVKRPDAGLEEKVRVAIARTKSALNAALRIASGADKLNQSKIDEAFAEFRTAYAELIALLGPLGVTTSKEPGFRTTPGGGLIVPEPMALTIRAK